MLEVLCSQRRAEPSRPGVFYTDLESLTGKPREHLEFTIWYLSQKHLIQRGDSSQLTITVEGIDYLEQHHGRSKQRLLSGATAAA